MEALDTTLYEEGTQIPLNPRTTSGQVRHRDTTVEKALDALEADGSVTTARLADGAVTSAKIADYNVIGKKIASGAITNDKIRAGAVSADKIAADAVVTEKIKDGAVTEAKIDAAYTEKVSAAIDAKLDKAAFLTDAEVNDIWDNN